MTWTLHQGDVFEEFDLIPDDSIHCCVTSPPYWKVRGYLASDHPLKTFELGQEADVHLHISNLVDVFEEVKRVLHPTGTCWINLQDVRAQHGHVVTPEEQAANVKRMDARGYTGAFAVEGWDRAAGTASAEIPPRNLCLIPERLALALQATGWVVRQRVLWHKPNRRASGGDRTRPRDDYEHVLMLVKSDRNFYNPEAVRQDRNGQPGRLLGSIWTIPTAESQSRIHTATMPPELARRCIALSTSEFCCSKCLNPYLPDFEKGELDPAWQRACGGDKVGEYHGVDRKEYAASGAGSPGEFKRRILASLAARKLIGWHPSCVCNSTPRACTVFDPFTGSGTTGVEALRLKREFVGIELSQEYLEEARQFLANALQPKTKRIRSIEEAGQIGLF